ncbi:hypothetical protein [Catellatospora chokoriensis]|uniref:hypothetical protein n=1 Tax=Catellatospora chokoriensis TaxID=310353 RepID=UPI00178622FB|nr:hypothetical protein [Catellatospora chokoriensis]
MPLPLLKLDPVGLLLALVLFGKLLLGVNVGGYCLGLASDLPVGQASQCGAVARGHLLVGAAGHVGDQDLVVVLSISTRTCCGAMLDVGFQRSAGEGLSVDGAFRVVVLAHGGGARCWLRRARRRGRGPRRRTHGLQDTSAELVSASG